ncbi:hypothetical protein [Rufibacter tibetensis]|uniref:Uncharacterized protein n=1 Tax=Rufibacter tibetensis TaxID=512763 RepID=A0A0P0CTH7_9BACT|nr:hypothetical protein [Rufibacter tibetensis]ALI99916.1 hypothetical protein DC20_14230 [Rufibacter tibetensis]
MSRIASKGMVFIFACTIVFHLLVLTSVIPFTIVGGGRVTNQTEMYKVETPALLNVFFLFVALVQAGYVRLRVSPKVLSGVLWFIFGIFLLNTVGNLFSNSHLEKLIFTPVTFILAAFSAILALNRTNKTA